MLHKESVQMLNGGLISTNSFKGYFDKFQGRKKYEKFLLLFSFMRISEIAIAGVTKKLNYRVRG